MQFDMEHCWDCPISFETALTTFVLAILCISVGIWLRRFSKPFVHIAGNALLAAAVLEIFFLNHAGQNWGITGIKVSRNALSLLLLLFAFLAAWSVVHFRKLHSKR